MENLKWATHEEHRAHTAMSPRSVEARERKAITKSTHAKVLDEKTVTSLKKMIWDPKRKLSYKQLAAKFGVSEMQIYRIKTGEFWYHIRVENEPLHPKHKQNLNNISFQEKRAEKLKSEKEKHRLSRLARSRKSEQRRAKEKADADRNKKALELIRSKKKREKALERARYLKLQNMAREKRIKTLSEKRDRMIVLAKGKKPAKKTPSNQKNYSIIKISGKRKK